MFGTVMAAVFFMCTPANIMADDNLYRVIDDGVICTYTASDNTLSAVMDENNITTDKGDLIDISRLESDSIIVISRLKDIYIKIDNNIHPVKTYKTDINSVLKESGIDMSDKILFTDEETKVEDGLVIDIRTKRSIIFNNNGNIHNTESYGNETVEEFLKRCSIAVGENDYISCDKNTLMSEVQNSELTYKKAITENITETSEIDYETEIKYDSSIKAGNKKTIQKGQKGQKETVCQVIKYYDGTVVSKEEMSSTITKAPQNETIAVGTKPGENKTYKNISVGDVITGRKSHYCVCKKCCGKDNGVTASGIKIKNGMDDPYIIACNWLPLGSVVDIDGKIYTVADRGGSRLSKTGYVDIFTPEGHDACLKKGVGSCKITILSL